LWRVSTSSVERQNRVLKIGDIWVMGLTISPNHFPRFYILGVEDLNVNKLFKITKLNSRGRAKKWFKRLNLAPAN
jgi:hypothetical protein